MTDSSNNRTATRPIVKGDRICLRCKGICHEDSLRSIVPESLRFRGGMRSHYFCSYTCMRRYYELKFFQELEQICKRQGSMDFYEEKVEEMGQERLVEYYEFVDVITE